MAIHYKSPERILSLLALFVLAACAPQTTVTQLPRSAPTPVTANAQPATLVTETHMPAPPPTAARLESTPTVPTPMIPTATETVTPSAVLSGRIAFSAKKGGVYQVFVVDPDGGNLIQVTDDPKLDHFALTWLPNGRRLIFGTSKPGGEQTDAIWIVDPDGTGETNLTNGYSSAWGPSISPDGNSMVFVSGKSGNADLYVMDLESHSVVKLTNSPSDDYSPNWSPDGQTIAFETWTPHGAHIYTIHPDGSQLKQLTDSTTDDINPVWSPDSRRLAFTATSPLASEVWMVNADGSGLYKVSGPLTADFPFWSPDDQKLSVTGADVQSSGGKPRNDIYLLGLANSGLTQITHSRDSMEYWGHGWSPDSIRLITIAGPSLEEAQLYLLTPDGSSMTALLHNDVTEPCCVVWNKH
jgi:dipeptidyl aminopeptidase/acylaminoacyl peptidase